MEKIPHKAGFVNIIGKPNAGKSTLMNALMGEKLAITTSKAQTTRHRIMGIWSGEDFQIVYSDTPGILENPSYELHRRMMEFVNVSLEDADIVLFVTDIFEKQDQADIIKRLKNLEVPIFLLLNKVDLAKPEQIAEKIEEWKKEVEFAEIVPVSALKNHNVSLLFDLVMKYLPEHEAYFPKDEMTDKSERFFAAEMLREKIFQYLKQEVPYSCEVQIESFKDEPNILRIGAVILVERDTQRAIVLGEKGSMIKKIGTEARLEMEKFFGKKVFLQQFVKVVPDWRNQKRRLEEWGYGGS